ncbi:hypothetical protein JQ615_40640 [Bradyrhizobium jicamae]|uniref:Uncharacterized protein n=1 Tax=Bradyrhizobium jicamae TaxID=280332 RepID=A0ABS5FXV2_9BRAD|nr:hypothetical protein [Bradyrhizobium jicamae]MBR0801659.1 hypothetical protein [Bradyrhizobium jicamae]MBR0935114.1 hypothetical protein [Bradyrhizobium jicamae]
MATLLVMDHAGDTRHSFDAGDNEQLAWAEARFQQLISDGYTAATRTGPGAVALVRALDPAAEETLFYPRLVGG